MSVFNPQLGTRLHIGASTYEFVPQQLLPGDAAEICMVEGQEGFIYVLRDMAQDTLCALKVMKPTYRGKHIAQVTAGLSQYRDTQGFYLSHRVCLERPVFDELITTFPALEFALLMPWLSWKTWAGLIRSPEASMGYTRHHALTLARAAARVLCELEQRGCAHTDIAGSNIMYAPDFQQVEVLDLEGLYMPGLLPPKRLSHGSPGYQHRRLGKQGQWSQYGDRFAGAILLTEILTWWHPPLRAQTSGNATSLFLPDELQTLAGSRWQIVRDVLWSLDPALLSLFDQAWASLHLKQCPDFMTWLSCLNALNPTPRQPPLHPLLSDHLP
jgi:serine/threonine protein kinase